MCFAPQAMIARRHVQGAVKHLPVYGKGAAGAYSSATMMNRQRFALRSATPFSIFHLQRQPSSYANLAQGPFGPYRQRQHTCLIVGPIGTAKSHVHFNNGYIYIHKDTYMWVPGSVNVVPLPLWKSNPTTSFGGFPQWLVFVYLVLGR